MFLDSICFADSILYYFMYPLKQPDKVLNYNFLKIKTTKDS